MAHEDVVFDNEASEGRNHESADVELEVDPNTLIAYKLRSFGDFCPLTGNKACGTENSTTKIADFLHTLSTKLEIPLDDIELIYQNKSTGNISHFSKFLLSDTKLAELGILPSTQVEYSFSLEKRRRKPKKLCFDDIGLEDSHEINQDVGSPESKADVDSLSEIIRRSSRNRDYTRKEFVGLKNQSSTCYMNSLLQALFFCPEFRNSLYLHNFKYDPEKKSVGNALKNLFLQLQFSTRWAIETENITRTFGWRENDSAVQHDIEELYRILMELLGEEFKKSHTYSITDSLFGGIMNDYVECLTCHKKNSKKTLFTALHLPVRLFGKPLPDSTLESSLKHYVAPEVLCDNNQYKCDNCAKLVDAHKGLSFEKLPYFMCILLQRSEFDFNEMTRKKCCDRLSFPEILNMNNYVEMSDVEDSLNTVHPINVLDVRGDKYNPSARTSHSRPHVQMDGIDEMKQSDNSSAVEINKMLEGGPNVYQLLSILIHRGRSSLAGHYYAYCIDLETGRWNMFNDTSVYRIQSDDLLDTYGGENSDQHGLAYMLIYRRIDSSINSLPLTFNDLPEEAVNLWKSLEEEEQQSSARETVENETMRVIVYYRGNSSWLPEQKEIVLTKSDSMPSNALKCFKEFFPDTANPDKPIRLVRYNEKKEFMDMSFDHSEETNLSSISRMVKGALMLETLSTDAQFEKYLTTDLVFKTHFVESQNDNLLACKEIHARKETTVNELCVKISQYFKKTPTKLALMVQTVTGLQDLTGEKDAELGSFRLLPGNCYDLFVEDCSTIGATFLDTYVENHYNSLIFEVICEIEPSCVGVDTNMRTPNGVMSDENDFVLMNVSEVSDDPASCSGVSNGVKNERLMMCSSEAKEVSKTTSPGSKINCSVDAANTFETCLKQFNSKLAVTGGSHYFRKMEEEVLASGWKRYVIKANKDMPLANFSRKIQAELEVDEAKLIVYKVSDGVEEEVLNYGHTLSNINFDSLRVKQGHRLIKGEGRARVFLLELDKPVEDSIALCDLVLNTEMTVKDVRRLIEGTLTSAADFNQEFLKSYRLRKKNQMTPSRVMKDKQKLKEYLPDACGDIYLQPISGTFVENDKSDDRWHCMLLYFWKPSELQLMRPAEIMFTYDYTVSLEALLAEKISTQFGIPKEVLQVARPEAEYPCELNPIVIHEKLGWFRLDNSTHNHISIHNDEGILFVRNSTDTLKDIAPEEKYILEKEAMTWRGEYTIPAPKKKIANQEIGIKINLARTPPTK